MSSPIIPELNKNIQSREDVIIIMAFANVHIALHCHWLLAWDSCGYEPEVFPFQIFVSNVDIFSDGETMNKIN